MRIAWICQHLWPQIIGGVELQVEMVSRHMRLEGHEVELWTADRPRGWYHEWPDGRKGYGMGFRPVPARCWRIAPLWRVGAGLKRMPRKADVCFSPDPLLSASFLLSRRNIPLVFTPGGTVLGSLRWNFPAEKGGRWAGRQYLWAERFCLGRSAGIVAVSEIVKSQMLRVSPKGEPRTRVVYNGYDPEKIDGGNTKTSEVFTVMCVARLHRIKNIDFLINAWSLVRFHPKKLVIVGDGGEMAELQRQAQRLGVQDTVDFLGERADVPDLLGKADVFVLPSQYEACPLAVIEAMAAGLPCLTLRNVEGVSEVGASGELNIDGETGFFVDPLDPRDLAGRIDFLATHPEEGIRMGKTGRLRARDRFTWARAGREYVRFAEELR